MEPLPWYKLAVPFAAVAGLGVACAVRPTERLKLVLLGAAVLGGYGVLQDQISARLCPEYFTVLHNPIPGVTNPTLLGLLWGFAAATPGGLILGWTAGLAATTGRHPPWPGRRLVVPMLALAGFAGFVTLVSGLTVARHADLFDVGFGPGLIHEIPDDRRRAAFVVACYHQAAYVAWAAGSVGLCVWVGVSRGRSLDGRGARV